MSTARLHSAGDPYAAFLDRALPYLQTRYNDLHTLLSRAYAERLLDREGGNPDVVIPAILLHDVGWSLVPEDKQLKAFGPNVKDPELTRVHEREGALLAETILADLEWPESLREEIVHIIAGHDTRNGSRTLHESLVRDADKLWRYDKQGFAIDCTRFEVDAAAYLDWLEAQVDGWFFTAAGAELAREEVAARRREL